MYKSNAPSRAKKPQLPIGISPTVKPTAMLPIKIKRVPGVRPPTIGLSRKYKVPKNIDKLIKSPILTNLIEANTSKEAGAGETKIPEEKKYQTSKTIDDLVKIPILSNPVIKGSTTKEVSGKKSNNKKEKKILSTLVQSEDTVKIPVVQEVTTDKVISQSDETTTQLKRNTRKRNVAQLYETVVKVPDIPITLENEDTSISYSPLDIPESTPNKDVIPENQKVLKAKRLILGSAKNTLAKSEDTVKIPVVQDVTTDKVISQSDETTTQLTRNTRKRNVKQLDEAVVKVADTPITVENEDTSISYSPLDVPENTPNKDVIPENQKVLKPKRLILGSAKNTLHSSPEKKLSTVSTKARKFSRLSLKRTRTTEDEDDDEIKPFKKKPKSKMFESDTSIGSNCSVMLDRLAEDTIKDHLDKEEEKVVEFIDLSQGSQERMDKQKLIDDIITLDQVVKDKKAKLDALKQSVIYKKKHDVNDLTGAAKVWKKGCKSALNDLLLKQQEVLQPDMTMDALLKQVNAPEEIFKYNPETEELI